MISSSFLDHHARGGTAMVCLTLRSSGLTSLVRIQAVLGCGEIVLAQHNLQQTVLHTVSCCQNMAGRDQNSSTAPDNVYLHY